MAINIGDIFGDYKVIEHAGAGGMAAVYKIEHLITRRVEAMKVLRTGIGAALEDVQRFEREIAVQARLNHPHIVALYNAVRSDESIAIIMEYVEGESLQSVLERGRLPLDTAVDYARQILDALAYAHDKGVIHRDVTPANIIITPEGTAKLMDFGLALTANEPRLTSSGVAVGSAWYMSPEQVRATDELDARTDLYAFGAVLHEMLTGLKLFEVEGPFAVMRAHIDAVPRPPSALNPGVPAAFDQIAAKALAKVPADRFQSAREFWLALEAAAPGMRNHGAKAPIGPPRVSAATVVMFGLTVLVIIGCTIVLLRNGNRQVRELHVPSESVSVPAPVMIPPVVTDPAPTNPPAGVQASEVAREVSRPARSSAAPPIRRPETPTLVITGNERVTPRWASPTPPAHPPFVAPESAPEEAVAAVPEARVPETPVTSPEPETVPQATEEPKPKKAGNRFVRALGKLNPFRKATASDGSAK